MTRLKTQETPPALAWESSLRYLKGIGPEKQKVLARLDLDRTLSMRLSGVLDEAG